jgi:hypothetical protein
MIDPRIAMGAQAPNLQTSLKLFQDTLNNIQGRKMNAQSMAQNEQMNPLRVQEAQQVVDSNANTADINRQNQNIQSIANYAPTLRKFLDNGDNMGAAQSLTQRIDFLERNGRDPTESREALQAITNGNPDMVLQALDIAEREAVSRGLVGGANGAVKPQSSKILADGTTIQVLNNGNTRVTSASGEELAGQDRVAAINKANEAEVLLSGNKEGARTLAREDVKTDAEVERENAVESKRLANIKSRLEIDETKIKSEADRNDAINAKNSRRAEAENASGTISTLLQGDFFSNAFGKQFSATPEYLRGEKAINADAQLEQITSLLSLESRQKLKGQGAISEGESNTLARSATILTNRLISPDLARKELRRVRDVFEDVADRNRLKQKTIDKQSAQKETPAPALNIETINVDELTEAEIDALLSQSEKN